MQNDRTIAVDRAAELHRLAQKYCWDLTPADAKHFPEKVILRTMDFGVLDDIFALQDIIGAEGLRAVLRNAPPGALRPRSWLFWHHRLGDLIEGAPPPPPPRAIA